MRSPRRSSGLLIAAPLAGLLGACATPATPGPTAAPAPPPRDWTRADERHLARMTALTAGGENAEAYWSWAGDELIMQASPPGAQCDRIFRLPVPAAPTSRLPSPVPVSSGLGATTCSYFLPGDLEVIFASTEGGSPTCPPKPDHSQGYVWALYPHLRHLPCRARRLGRAAPHDDARLRRRGDGLREGRLDRVHVGARRRHRSLPHGR